MVIIPKAGKDHSKMKGWRPIVLANTVGKLAEKLVAEEPQGYLELWHSHSYAGRKGRGAIDSVLHMDGVRAQTGGTVYGRDIQAAFNSLGREKLSEILAGEELTDIRVWTTRWLEPRHFEIYVDGRRIGAVTMTQGTPQGSPLSPTLSTVYMSAMVWRADQLIKENKVRTNRQPGLGQLENRTNPVFLPLSYIDDVNSVRGGRPERWIGAWRPP